MSRLILFLVCILGSLPVRSQIMNNYYFADKNNVIIDNLKAVAIAPGWVQLKPDVYAKLPEKLKTAEEEASLFFQDLLYSSLLLTSPSQLKDIYIVNSLLVDGYPLFPRISLRLSPVELCEILQVDAVLLTFASYDKSFVVNNPGLVDRLKQVNWNRPVKRKDVVIILFYKDGTPLWAASFDTNGINSTVREENQQFPINLYGYFVAKN